MLLTIRKLALSLDVEKIIQIVDKYLQHVMGGV
jgi:hypothetical protein